MHTTAKFTEPEYDPCKDEWEAYLKAAKEAVDAAEAARPLATLSPLKDGEQGPELRIDGQLTLRRVHKANQTQAAAYKVWVDCRKAHGIGVG